ncbi:hypothetical protein [Rhodococcus olei]|uniref:hypothetical protein n=1 Tax=Rhodococcus olei TaxID=2161675 RepID=UPI0031E6C7D4
MELELVYFDGCPNWQTARERLDEALAAVGRRDISVASGHANLPVGGQLLPC